MLAYKVSSGGVAGFLLSILSNYFNQEPACTTIRNCLGELWQVNFNLSVELIFLELQ